MVRLRDSEFPDHLLYDIENQIWYVPLDDGTARAGFTQWAANLMGDVLVFTPKRIGRDFEKNRSFAVVEGGKCVGAARAALAGVVLAQNQLLVRKPELMNSDAYGEGWMLIVQPADASWRGGLITGGAIAPALEGWGAARCAQGRRGCDGGGAASG